MLVFKNKYLRFLSKKVTFVGSHKTWRLFFMALIINNS